MPRIGSLIVYIGDEMDGLTSRVGKILKKSYQKRSLLDEEEPQEICLVKLNYNGSLWLISHDQLRGATKEEKKGDKKNPTYWGNEYSIHAPIRYVCSACQI